MQEDWNITLSVLDCPDKSFIGHQKVFFTSPISIGRAENNDLIIPDPTVSRNHTILRITNDYTRVFITDLSTHGTEVSGKPVPKGRGTGFTIENGDTIKLGDTILRYELKLKLSVQSTFVGKMVKSFLATTPEPVEKVTEEPIAEIDTVTEPIETEKKGFSPLAIIIIVVCLLFMVYLIFFAK